MLKFRRTGLARAGFIGVTLIALVVIVGLSPQQLIDMGTAVRYQAEFTDASGLETGNDVVVSGVNVGTVSDVSLGAHGAVVTFTVKAAVHLGGDTTAHIRTGSLLGQRELGLVSDGPGSLSRSAIIPTSRTFAPYTLTDAVGELTANTAATDTASINGALDALSSTIDQIAPQLGPAFDGLTRISRSLNERNESLVQLFSAANDVTGVLSARSAQVNTLILNGSDLLATLSERRYAIVELLANVSAVSKELSGLVADNEKDLAPALQKLNAVTEVLERNRDNIATALPRLAKYQVTLGETVSNGPFYTAYVPNFDLPPVLQPFFDYAFGFRRGTNAGQPPDNAGPRAEIPFPRNGIPERPR
jgi:phospholipid/cholesterol/gamma-HCH transport system substrate-binding protein